MQMCVRNVMHRLEEFVLIASHIELITIISKNNYENLLGQVILIRIILLNMS